MLSGTGAKITTTEAAKNRSRSASPTMLGLLP
jgi:hypothetical protein